MRLEIKVRAHHVCRKGSEHEIRKLQLVREVLFQRKRCLEKRVSLKVTLGLELLDEFFKWDVLVTVSLQGHIANALQKFTKGRIAGQISTQHKGVCENSNQTFQLSSIAVGYGRANANVIFPGITVQQDQVGRKQRHA